MADVRRLMEAQRYPEDFDGIIAGAPANNWSHLFTGFIWNEQALAETPIPACQAASHPDMQWWPRVMRWTE